MAAKPQKPTKQQLEQAKLRAASSGIKMDQSAKGLRNAGKAIAVGASTLPAGRAVKAAGAVVKGTKIARKAQAVKELKQNKKIVEEVARLQEKTKAETIAKNSVKVRNAKDEAVRKAINSESSAKTMTAKTGAAARYYAGKVASKKPAKVIKIK